MDLLSLTLTLRPLPQPDPTGVLPEWWGRAAHKLLLDVVDAYAPRLTARLHDPDSGGGGSGNTVRPFTVSSLLGRFPHGALDPQAAYHLRLTALEAELAAILQQAALQGPLSPGQRLELDYHPFEIRANSLADPASADPWAAADAYAELSAALLLSKTPAPRRLALHFASPTTFKSGGRHVPIPLPELVFGSLLERWNAFAPIAFPPEARRYAAECLAISRYRLASRPAPLKANGLRVGGVGEATYTSLSYDRYWMSVLGVLAAFALYSGVGAGVTMGLGQARQSAADATAAADAQSAAQE